MRKKKTPKCLKELESLSNEEILNLEKSLFRKGIIMGGAGLSLFVILFIVFVLVLLSL